MTLAPAAAVRAATALLLLAPSPPMLFMGEEWGATEPLLFFSDFAGDLGRAVARGRREEFARFPEFADPERRERIPDPQAEDTFRRSALGWEGLDSPPARERLAWVRGLLALRSREIAPLLRGAGVVKARALRLGERALAVEWICAAGGVLRLVANLGPAALAARPPWDGRGRQLLEVGGTGSGDSLGPWHVVVSLEGGPSGARA
jgi:1,4-alpha-glucan branching enzyme